MVERHPIFEVPDHSFDDCVLAVEPVEFFGFCVEVGDESSVLDEVEESRLGVTGIGRHGGASNDEPAPDRVLACAAFDCVGDFGNSELLGPSRRHGFVTVVINCGGHGRGPVDGS